MSRFTESRTDIAMGKKYSHLFEQMIQPDNLWRAYQKTARGKHTTLEYLIYRQHEASNLKVLHQLLLSGQYSPTPPRQFQVFEPKLRVIDAPTFTDRIAQHALCNIIEPIFDKTFLPQSYACRTGRGTHSAARQTQALMRRLSKRGQVYCLKTDFSRYFASIDRERLHQAIRQKISCQRTLKLIETIVPPTGVGLPIGSLSSQLFANVYGNIVDQWLVHAVGESRFVRYMDDIVILAHTPEYLHALRLRLAWFAEAELGLRFSHWSIQPISRGVNFVGYRIWTTHKLLRRASVQRAKRTLKCLPVSSEVRQKFLAAWQGHAKHADSYNLRKYLGVL